MMRKRFYLILGALALALVVMPAASYAGCGSCGGDKKCDGKKEAPAPTPAPTPDPTK